MTRFFRPCCLLLLALVASVARAQSISASQHRTCASSADGHLYCWGYFDFGGQSISADSTPIAPVSLAGDAQVTQVATGWMHDCALLSTGAVQCVGINYLGELARGRDASCREGEADGACTRSADMGPIAGELRFRSLVSGSMHSCGLTKEGIAYCWGYNRAGETGTGLLSKAVFLPTAVAGGHHFRQLSTRMDHTCGVTLAGAVYCWGVGREGELGSNPASHGCRTREDACTRVPVRLDDPRRNFVQVSAGYLHTCALSKTGAVYCWGGGYSRSDSLHAQKIVRVSATFPFRSLSAGYAFTCGVSKDGRAYCWAEPYSVAAVGRTLVVGHCSHSRVCLDEIPVSEHIRFRAVTSAENHACGISTSGRVYCWGLRDISKLGRAQNASETPPLCRRLPPGSDSRCADEPVEVSVPNLLLRGVDESGPP